MSTSLQPYGLLQATILEWGAFPSPGDLTDPRIEPASLASAALVGRFFTTGATWEVPLSHIWLFCARMDCSLLGSSVHGISQARILEWVTISFSKGSFWPKDRIHFCISRRVLYHWATEDILKKLTGVQTPDLLSHLRQTEGLELEKKTTGEGQWPQRPPLWNLLSSPLIKQNK